MARKKNKIQTIHIIIVGIVLFFLLAQPGQPREGEMDLDQVTSRMYLYNYVDFNGGVNFDYGDDITYGFFVKFDHDTPKYYLKVWVCKESWNGNINFINNPDFCQFAFDTREFTAGYEIGDLKNPYGTRDSGTYFPAEFAGNRVELVGRHYIYYNGAYHTSGTYFGSGPISMGDDGGGGNGGATCPGLCGPFDLLEGYHIDNSYTCQNSNDNCFIEDQGQTCTDTDGGQNPNVKGIVTTNIGSWTDSCNLERVKEYYCTSDNSHQYKFMDCQSGYECSDGVCVESSTAEDWCKDTDSSTYPTKEYSTKGVLTTSQGHNENDFCHTDGVTLTEMYCVGPLATDWDSENYDCSTIGKVCGDGRCVDKPIVEWCKDTDSSTYPTKEYTIKGVLTTSSGNKRTDECIDSNRVKEWYCNKEDTLSFGFVPYDCSDDGQLCSNGKCVGDVTNYTGDCPAPPYGAGIGDWFSALTSGLSECAWEGCYYYKGKIPGVDWKYLIPCCEGYKEVKEGDFALGVPIKMFPFPVIINPTLTKISVGTIEYGICKEKTAFDNFMDGITKFLVDNLGIPEEWAKVAVIPVVLIGAMFAMMFLMMMLQMMMQGMQPPKY